MNPTPRRRPSWGAPESAPRLGSSLLATALTTLLALLETGCGARSSLPAPDVQLKSVRVLLTQGSLSQWVTPVDRSDAVTSFYDYTSASAHTGFEALGASELFLYRDTTEGVVSLVTEHGIDVDSSGIAQPESIVQQRFEGLPDGVTVAISDDSAKEFFMDSGSTAAGDWHFNGNTDGGVLSGLPLPGSWSVTITSSFVQGIETWRFFDGAGEEIALDPGEPAVLTASE